jgi:Zn ribbon nucleic-acid-binding protein
MRLEFTSTYRATAECIYCGFQIHTEKKRFRLDPNEVQDIFRFYGWHDLGYEERWAAVCPYCWETAVEDRGEMRKLWKKNRTNELTIPA